MLGLVTLIADEGLGLSLSPDWTRARYFKACQLSALVESAFLLHSQTPTTPPGRCVVQLMIIC